VQVVIQPDFSLTGPGSLTFVTGGTGAETLSLGSIGAFAGTISMTCGGQVPAGYTCSLGPADVPLAAGGSATTVLTLEPTKTGQGGVARLVLALLLPGIFLLARRRGVARKAIVLLAVLGGGVLVGCGPNGARPATLPGTYVINVEANGTAQGSSVASSHQMTVLVNVLH